MLTIEHYDSDKLIAIVEEHLRKANVESWDREWLLPYCSVHQDNIIAFLDGIDERYGGVKNYLITGLGLSQADLDKMHHCYLEG